MILVSSFELPETALVIAVLFIIFLIGSVALVLRATTTNSQVRVFVASAPSILSTVGVLGTFFGIWLGLQDFDVTAIDSSVPTLLEGLKTAFVTSLWGMALSVVFRICSNVAPVKAGDAGSALAALTTLIEEQRRTREVSEQGFEAMRQAIAGDGESALSTQVSKLRTELRDEVVGLGKELQNVCDDAKNHHREHIEELRAFADHMVKNTNKALIDALKEVIRDFNHNLTEQFGENFKALNSAVERLVDWQQRYRQHIEEMEGRVNAAVQALERSSVALGAVETSATQIPQAIEPLGPTLVSIKTSLDRVNHDLEAYADLHDKARSAFPIVNQNLDDMTTGLRQTVEQMTARTDSALDQQRQSHAVLEAGYGELSSQAHSAQERFSSAVDSIMLKVGEELRTATEIMAQSLNDSFSETDRRLQGQVKKVDESLGRELESALKMMADNLGGMSNKFVEDYSPLTNQLREIVRLAASANEPRSSIRHNGG